MGPENGRDAQYWDVQAQAPSHTEQRIDDKHIKMRGKQKGGAAFPQHTCVEGNGSIYGTGGRAIYKTSSEPFLTQLKQD